MSVNNVSLNSVPQQQRKQSNAPFVLTSAGVGALGGGAYGYMQNNLVNKEGFYTDEFLSRTASEFTNQDKVLHQQLNNAADEFSVLKNIEKNSSSSGKLTHKEIKNYLMKNAEVLGITPENGETLNSAVNRYMRERPQELLNSDIYKSSNDSFLLNGFHKEKANKMFYEFNTNEFTRNGKTYRAPAHNNTSILMDAVESDLTKSFSNVRNQLADHLNKDWITNLTDCVFDRQSKKFRAVSQDAPQELMDIIKKCAKEVNSTGAKLKNAAILGGIAAIALGATSYVMSVFTGKKS